MEFLVNGIMALTWQQVVMFIVGGVLIFLAISKKLEPALLLPIGFGAILVNIPLSGAIDQVMSGIGNVNGIIDWLFSVGIEASEAMPLLLFIGIGAMIDFGPLLKNPKLLFFGAAAQFGIFATITAAAALGFSLPDAASIGIIGAADGPTSILAVSYTHLYSAKLLLKHMGAWEYNIVKTNGGEAEWHLIRWTGMRTIFRTVSHMNAREPTLECTSHG